MDLKTKLAKNFAQPSFGVGALQIVVEALERGFLEGWRQCRQEISGLRSAPADMAMDYAAACGDEEVQELTYNVELIAHKLPEWIEDYNEDGDTLKVMKMRDGVMALENKRTGQVYIIAEPKKDVDKSVHEVIFYNQEEKSMKKI